MEFILGSVNFIFWLIQKTLTLHVDAMPNFSHYSLLENRNLKRIKHPGLRIYNWVQKISITVLI